MTAALTIPPLAEWLPRVLPPAWRDLGVVDAMPERGFVLYGYRWQEKIGPGGTLEVRVSLDNLNDDVGAWLHSSVSRSNRLPSWADLTLVHQVIHQDRPVIQVLPPRSSWLNAMPYCLHLFERLDADTVPPGLWRRS